MREERLKEYRSYRTPQKCGIRCSINRHSARYPLHRHDYIEIEYLACGALLHELNGARSALQAGDCVGLGYGDLHRFEATEYTVIHNLCIRYPDAPPQIQAMLDGAPLPFTAHVSAERLPVLNEYFLALARQIERETPFASERIAAYMVLILSEILPVASSPATRSVPTGYSAVAHALDYISTHFDEPLTLTALADRAGFSQAYFSKLFTRVCGESFCEVLTAKRIEHARALLRSTDQSVSEIALRCGFGSFASFSRAFRARCGCSPRHFRNQTQ